MAGKVDKLSMVTYVSSLYKALQRPPNPAVLAMEEEPQMSLQPPEELKDEPPTVARVFFDYRKKFKQIYRQYCIRSSLAKLDDTFIPTLSQREFTLLVKCVFFLYSFCMNRTLSMKTSLHI